MKKLLLIVSCLIAPFILGQNIKENSFWDLLLKNERVKAEKKLSKKKDLNSLFEKQILEVEKGDVFRSDLNFIEEAKKSADFQYYLYAFWFQPYLLSDYKEIGWRKNSYTQLQSLLDTPINVPLIKSSLNYTHAAASRFRNQWEMHNSIIGSLNTINNWQYCGVFENMNESGLDIYYEPENYAKNDKLFDGNSNGKFSWYTPKPSTEFYQVLYNHNIYGTGVNYAQTFINNPEKKEVELGFTSSAAAKIWLNDVLIHASTKDVIQADVDKYTISFTLPKGTNRLLVKLAESSDVTYFLARLFDENGKAFPDVTFQSEYAPYNKSTRNQLNLKELEHPVELFFKNKIKEEPNNFFNVLALSNVYARNSKLKEQKELLLPYLKKYPKSSLLKILLAKNYSNDNMAEKANELLENVYKDDPDYYMTLVNDFADYNKLMKKTTTELQELKERATINVKSDVITEGFDLMINIKSEDKEAVKKNVDNLMESDLVSITSKLATIYDTFFGEKDKTIQILEDLDKKYYNENVILTLLKYYKKENNKEKVYALLEKYMPYSGHYNYYLNQYIEFSNYYNDYDKTLELVNLGLTNYPFDFTFQELKGSVLMNLDKKKEAVKWYKKSLSHNSGKRSLRKKINDLSGLEKSYINKYHTDDLYDFIKNNKGKITDNYYGYNLLFDEKTTEFYTSGGGETRLTSVYEITAPNGIEYLKEMNLNLNYPYEVFKSEIVKPDGSITPADRQDKQLVFKNLNIGDVVYIDYLSSFFSSGRFYKDATDSYLLTSEHENILSKYTIIADKGYSFNKIIKNSDFDFNQTEVQFKESKDNDKIIYQWKTENTPVVPIYEAYQPHIYDTNEIIHISTISSWTDIAHWYSDLVRAQIEKDDIVVQGAFKTIFPNGFQQLDERERAQRIYQYMMNNLTYSFVDFRQSGFIPQKPSKTISSKLGDCKDFSTLFLVLGQMAKLDVNLVLVLTADNGTNSLVLPSTDFNHCIAKVKLNGKDQYLELTNKYLPFASLPTTLYNAKVLDIPLKTSNDDKFEIYNLKNTQHIPSVFKIDSKIELSDSYHIKNHVTAKGLTANFPISKFETASETELKDIFKNWWNNSYHSEITIKSVENKKYELGGDGIEFDVNLTAENGVKKLGKLKVIELPILIRAYNRDVINLDKRNYPIRYSSYENVEEYHVNMELKLRENEKFEQIPDNAEYKFKGHSFTLTYDLVKDNILKIQMLTKTPWDDISPEDYLEYKKYVNQVLEANNAFIGFK